MQQTLQGHAILLVSSFTNAMHDGAVHFCGPHKLVLRVSLSINRIPHPLQKSNAVATQLQPDELCPTATAPSALQHQETVLQYLFLLPS